MTTVGKVVRRGWALFALPTVLCFAVFFVVPLAMGIYLSFTSFRTVTDAKWVGLKNYVDARFRIPNSEPRCGGRCCSPS